MCVTGRDCGDKIILHCNDFGVVFIWPRISQQYNKLLEWSLYETTQLNFIDNIAAQRLY